MSRAGIGLALLLALAGGCDRDGRIDAGGDAGPRPDDASIDGALPPVDAEVDASVDGGPPDPVVTAVEQAQADATTAEAAQAALDPSVTMGLEFVQLALAQTRVDAIIGEKRPSLVAAAGIIGEKTTLAFGTPLAATVVALRQLRQAELELTAVVGVFAPTDPTFAPLRDALLAEIASLGALRTQMLAYYDELVALDATLPGSEDTAYVDRRSVHTMPETSFVEAILEGSATDTDGSVTVVCARGSTAPLAVSVLDQEATSLVTGTGAGPHSFLLRADEPTLLRVELTLSGVPHDECDVQVQGRRHFRAPPTVLDATATTDLGTLRDEWNTRMSTLTGTITMMRSEGDATDAGLATIVEGYLREASSESGRWRGGLASIGPEDRDVLTLTLTHVEVPMSMALEAALATSTSRFAGSVETLLGELRTRNEAALEILTTAP